MGRKKDWDPQVFSITSTASSKGARVQERRRIYLGLMAARVVAFLAAILLPLPMWGRIFLIALAVVIPYLAVVFANSDRKDNISGKTVATPRLGNYVLPSAETTK